MTSDPSAAVPGPTRVIHLGDGPDWLRRTALGPEHAVVTSLPDVSELSSFGFAEWRAWFIQTAALACERTAGPAVTIFFQTDIKHEGRWVDKGYLVARGAELAGSELLWHKVVCRAPAGTTTFGRPAYAHLLCFSRELRLAPGRSSPDVLPKLGQMPWARAMGVEACEAVCTFLLAHTACATVVDPFCGVGTVLAVANRRGLSAVGVERSPKRAAKAQTLELPAAE